MFKEDNLQLFLDEEYQNTLNYLIDNSYYTSMSAKMFGLTFNDFVTRFLNHINQIKQDQEFINDYKNYDLDDDFEEEDIKYAILKETQTLEINWLNNKTLLKIKTRQLVWDSFLNNVQINSNFVNENEKEILKVINFWNNWKN